MGFEEIKELVKILKEKDNFILSPHLNPDPDALGSTFGLGIILNKLNKNFAIYLEEEIPPEFQFLPLKNKIANNIDEKFNVAIILDCDRISRTGENFYSALRNKFTILIDHHQTNLKDANFNLVMETNSTSEIIYYLTKELNIDFDQDLATALLLGILGDTLILTVEMEKEKLLKNFEIVKDLIEKGGNYYLIIKTLIEKDWNEFKEMLKIGSTAEMEDGILFLSIDDEKNDAGITSRIANFLNQIRDAKIVVVFKKQNQKVKISLRSKSDIDVGYLAKEYFNGGGHKNAAGGFLEMDINSAKNFVLEKLKEYLNK
jgi:bifunctional oligoribonuclease and PAP phosphatase NrnA